MKFLSLFSGIEAASVAWKSLGWQCVGVAEIDPFPCAVLAHHYPDVPNLGDVTQITDEQIAALGPIDVVVGGSPCQDLSVAGKRVGLAGERSGLFHEQLRIFHAARHLCGARFLVWENVPGAFSSHAGRDFAVVVGAMAGCRVDVPEDGWGTEGVALGEHGLVEWAVLDAQWFGVAQRRRRVFAVLDVGDWSGRPPILLERESLRGDSAPSREAGQRVAPVLAGCSNGGGANGPGRDVDSVESLQVISMAHGQGGAEIGFDCDGGLIHAPEIARCDATREGSSQDYETTTMVVAGCIKGAAIGRQPHNGPQFGDAITDGSCYTLTTNEVHAVAHTLRAEGFDASEDGTGRGTPLVPVVAGTMKACKESGGWSNSVDHAAAGYMVPVAVDVWNQSIDGDVAATLTAASGAPNHSGPKVMVPVVAPCLTSNYGKQPDSSDTSAGPMLVPVPIQNATRGKDQNGLGIGHAGDPMYTLDQASQHAVAFTQNQRDEVRELTVAGALAAEPGVKQQTYVAFHHNAQACQLPGVNRDTSVTDALTCSQQAAVAFTCKDYGADAGEVAPTLRSMGHDGSHANGGGQVAVAFVQGELDGRMVGGTQEGASGLPAGPVRAVRRCQGRGSPQERGLAGQQPTELAEAVPQLSHQGAPLRQAVPVVREAAQGSWLLRDALPEVEEARRPDGSWMADPDEVLTAGVPRNEPRARALQQTCTTDAQRDAREASVEQKRAREEAMGGRAFQVRRLTPTECSRLQGFPDDYLSQVPWRGKSPPPDGPMYKALGNSFAVPCVSWIGKRLQMVAEISNG